ncbi:MAG: sulfate ABC transporter substrate-binding protein [Clostridium sp.]
MKSLKKLLAAILIGTTFVGVVGCTSKEDGSSKVKILNVSYDPTRELYEEYNKEFIKHWKETKGQDVEIEQSNGGSSKQARAVIDGLEADVVTLALAYDINSLNAKQELVNKEWVNEFPHNSTPYTSTIVFLVRKGNPKGVKEWDDLVKEGVSVITANPKTSGGARWAYLAAWGYAYKKNNNDENKAKEFIKELYSHVPVLDSGTRGATTTFTERGIGDVLIAWENEAKLSLKELGEDKYEIVYPKISILAEPPVALVKGNTEKHGTTEVAKEYLNYLYSDVGQEIISKNFYRPINKEIEKKYENNFPKIELFTLKEIAGDWNDVQKKHFEDNGIFDEITTKK